MTLSLRLAAVLLCAVLVALAGCFRDEPTLGKPVRRIVLVSLDTLRPDHLGIYGYARDTSPSIDAFAKGSFVVERALAPAPNTPPSQMSMMTSLYPSRHGFSGDGDKLDPDIETLAERLHSAGFATGGFVDGGYLRSVFGFNRGFDVYDDRGGGLAKILPKALRWLEERGDESFFLFLHTYDIHAPYISPPPFAGMFHEKPYSGDLVPTVARLDRLFRDGTKLPAEAMQHLVDCYDEGIRYTDWQLGRLFDRLHELGRLEDTLVILTSDHGEEFGEHGSLLHWQLYYQPNLRIPLILRPPGGVDGPQRIRDTAELIDILPTLLDWSDSPPLAAAQGRSLVPILQSANSGKQVPLQGSAASRGALGWWARPKELSQRSLILGDHQLIFYESGPGNDALYDIAKDPLAQRNLAAEHPEVVTRLRQHATEAMAANQGPRVRGEETPVILDSKTREALRALGYDP